MKAIILAAGVGQRLANISDGKPKCLLEIDGMSLLRRHLMHLKQNHIDDITIVTGYKHEEIVNSVNNLTQQNVTIIFNSDFKEGSVISLDCAKSCMEAGEDVLIMDADVLYDAQILEKLIHSKYNNCFLLDQDFVPGDEPVKLCVKDNTIIEFRKKVPSNLEYDICGESVGFFKYSSSMAHRLAEKCRLYAKSDKRDWPHEEAIRDLLLEEPDAFNYEDVSGLAWIEIDFPDDVIRAKTEIINKI
jgi:choline kinase